MLYQPLIERSIRRLGLVHPEYAGHLAILMDENEGQNPKQIGLLFRQHGTPLSNEEKRALGLRANTDMTREAWAAITDKGRDAPLDAVMNTVLDAQFAFFRQRSVKAANDAGYNTFKLDGIFECTGCARLSGQLVHGSYLAEIPPHDCTRPACSLGMQLHVDFIQELIDSEAEANRQASRRKSWFARLWGGP